MASSLLPRQRLPGLVPGLALLFLVGLASGQEAAAPEQPAPTWTVNCSGAAGQAELACTLSQTLIMKDKGERVLTAVVTKRDGKYVLNLSLPHGLNLTRGVDIWIDEAARQTYPIVTADQNGSYAMITLDDTLISAFKKGKLLNVAVTAYVGNKIILQLSLTGFAAGFSRL